MANEKHYTVIHVDESAYFVIRCKSLTCCPSIVYAAHPVGRITDCSVRPSVGHTSAQKDKGRRDFIFGGNILPVAPLSYAHRAHCLLLTAA